MIVRATAALLAVVAIGAPGTALAAGCPKTTMPAVEQEVMCLQCGVPLNLAEDAPSAQRERALIQTLIDRCQSKDQIKRVLVAQFGSRVLAEPKSSSAWLVPVLGFAAGAVLVAIGALRWRRQKRRSPAPAAVSAGSPDAGRLQADLDRYDL